jgi:hypothetical protein
MVRTLKEQTDDVAVASGNTAESVFALGGTVCYHSAVV